MIINQFLNQKSWAINFISTKLLLIAFSSKVSSNILFWLHKMINIFTSSFWKNITYKFISSKAFSVFFLTLLLTWWKYYKIACIFLRRKPRVCVWSHESKGKSWEEIRNLIFMSQSNQAKFSFITCGLSKEQRQRKWRKWFE